MKNFDFSLYHCQQFILIVQTEALTLDRFYDSYRAPDVMEDALALDANKYIDNPRIGARDFVAWKYGNLSEEYDYGTRKPEWLKD